MESDSTSICFYSELSGGNAAKVNSVPVADQQAALCILTELAVQRATLSHMLDIILLLLSVWSGARHKCDNRVASQLISAPLLPLLQRFSLIHEHGAEDGREEHSPEANNAHQQFCDEVSIRGHIILH